MNIQSRASAFVQLGVRLQQLSGEPLNTLAESARLENPWFTKQNVNLSLRGIMQYLQQSNLMQWLSQYDFNHVTPKVIGVVMAGNIPLVGFHDFLCVLLSGHNIRAKVSSKDSVLIRHLVDELVAIEPRFRHRIVLTSDPLAGIDAVIATGSDNSARYFEYYFRKYPHIIRKNRTSVAVLTGTESDKDILELGQDIFSYFGLGCRNVSKLFLPCSFDLSRLLNVWEPYRDSILHHKYANNYDYQKSILLVNQTPFLDNGFILLVQSDKLVSPIATLYYEFYENTQEVKRWLTQNQEKIQCVVGNTEPASVSFGNAQFPRVWEYADNVDTMKFLAAL